MNDLTRRKFLHTAAGVAAGSAIVGRDAFFSGEGIAADNNSDSTKSMSHLPFQPLIFPQPQEITYSDSDFVVHNNVRIIVPTNALEEDIFLARSLANELNDKFDLRLMVEYATSFDGRAGTILMGSIRNPLVRQYCSQMNSGADKRMPGPEGYIFEADKNVVLVAGSDDRGAFYGLQSLRQLVCKENGQVLIRGAKVRDWPDKPFRGIYLFLPGRENIQFFKRFVRDYMALYKYNTLIMEMGASMRLDTHPELNSGWVRFARDCNYSCRNYPPGPFHNLLQNSSHQDTADGGFLEKEEVAELASWVKKHQIELIPELASFSHSYYLLAEDRDIAAVPENRWPDVYCPSNPKTYSLVFDVFDEYIDLLKPRMIQIGHDELFLPVGASPSCKVEDVANSYGEDIRRIHGHLSSRGVKTALWGDMLLESGHKSARLVAKDGWVYYKNGSLSPEQVKKWIPKDCLIFNWLWQGASGASDEALLDKLGFQQIYGNFEPTIENYETRKKRSTLLGGAPSAWFATNEFGFGKELMSSFLGCSNILWTGHVLGGQELSARVQSMIPSIRTRLSGITSPSHTEISVATIDISSKFNIGNSLPELDTDLSGMVTGRVQIDRVPFDLKSSNGMHSIVVGTAGREGTTLLKSVTGILVGAAPISLIFLHASAKPATNKDSFRLIWDQEDTADLLGWYEVVYQDGFTITIPIRYGVNILEWNRNPRVAQTNYCYGADALEIGGSKNNNITFFAFEWTNPRLGKVIKEIRLSGTIGFRGASDKLINDYGPVIESNTVILKAISMVQKRVNVIKHEKLV